VLLPDGRFMEDDGREMFAPCLLQDAGRGGGGGGTFTPANC